MAARLILAAALASAALALPPQKQGARTDVCTGYSQCPTVTTPGDRPLENTLEDERVFRQLTFKWSIAWDRKDKDTWLAITSPQIVADYTDYPAVGRLTIGDPGQFFDSSFTVTNLGDERLQTQHFLGAVLFTRANATVAHGDWQARARHVRDFHNGTVNQWDSSSFVEFSYEKMNDTWVISGIRPHTVVAETGRPEEVIGSFNYTA